MKSAKEWANKIKRGHPSDFEKHVAEALKEQREAIAQELRGRATIETDCRNHEMAEGLNRAAHIAEKFEGTT